MGIIGIIVTLMLIGVVLYFFNTMVTMDAKIKQIINVIVLIAVFLWLLCVFHIFCFSGFHNVG